MSSLSTDPRTSAATTLVDVEMPQLGVSVTEGTLVVWRKAVGDEIAYEEPICDVATDKIDVELPSPAAGVVAELLVEPDETVPVGTVMARIAVEGPPPEGGHDLPAPVVGEVPDPAPEPQPPAPAPPHPGPPDPGSPTPPAPDPAPPAAPTPQSPVIQQPASVAFVSPVVRRIATEHGIDTGQVSGSGRLGRVTKRDILRALREREATAEPAEAPMHIESPYREDPPQPAPNGAAAAKAAAPAPAAPQAAGPVPAATAATAPAPSAPVPEIPSSGEPLSRVRRLIGEHMRRSLDTAAHCTTIFEADMSAVDRRRKAIGTTYLPVIARCVVEALREHPALNAWLQDDRITRYQQVHLGIAVDLGESGLVVPVIRDAQTLSEEGLAEAIRDLAGRARAGQLTPGETDGGTFTITNPGALGAIAATPVISLPQVAILDLEAIVKRPVVISGPDGSDAIAIRPMTNLCMSWDHRALDGAAAARFLATLRDRLERL